MQKIKAAFPLLKNYSFTFIRDQSHFVALHSLITPVKVPHCFLQRWNEADPSTEIYTQSNLTYSLLGYFTYLTAQLKACSIG